MRTRVRELIEIGDKLFKTRERFTKTCQAIAEQLYPERADFVSAVTSGEEIGADLVTGTPVMARRDLADALSAMLRPREKAWFHAHALNEHINKDATAKQFFDRMTEVMRNHMYAKPAQFIRATKQGDNDFATFGQCVIEASPNRNLDGLLFRPWHLRDVAWCENAELAIDTVHRNWKPEIRVLCRMFGDKVHASVKEMHTKEPGKEINCRHIVVPAEDYDYSDKTRKRRASDQFVSIFIDCENDTIMEEKYVRRIRYIIPRWVTLSGSQYAISPGAVIAYRDARLLQQMTLTLLEVGEKVVDPPSVGVAEAIQGGINLYAGGHTWIDSEYDERSGDVLRYMPIDAKGLNFGIEREQMVMQAIHKALYLDRISVPYPQGDMTATEYRGRVEEYIRRALPLFEPMEVEYNGGICEETFDLLLGMGAFGSPADWPEIVRGQDLRWSFESPLQAATERSKSQAFIDTTQLLKTAMELDPSVRFDVSISKGFRDAVPGTGAPAEWLVPEEEANQARAQQAEIDQAQQAAAAMAQSSELVGQAGDAAARLGAGAQQMDAAGA